MQRPRTLAGSLGLVLLLGSFASSAAAQGDPLGQFSVLRYYPAPGPGNYGQLDGAAVRGDPEFSAGLQLVYAHEPFVLYRARNCDAMGNNCEASERLATLSRYVAAAPIWFSVALFHRLQLSLIVPLAITEGDRYVDPDPMGMGAPLLEGGFGFAIADPRLHVKGNILDDHASGFRLAASAWVSAPLGQAFASERQAARFLGDQDPSFGGSAIAEIVTSGIHGVVHLGGLWRDGDTLFSTSATAQMTYGAAFGYEITPLIFAYGELIGGTSFSGDVDENPLEARLGGRLRFSDFQVDLFGGAGIIGGAGVPLFHLGAGFAWAPQRADSDGDSIDDALDSCPTDREDADGWHDDDGCPELDNDEDGLNDEVDSCRDEAEDVDGEDDGDGCPDADDDGDGIHDGYDSCPHEPEDVDGDRDDDGCPDNDRDRDHIDDTIDQCADEPEDTDGFGDEDGCPETDFDQDGNPDDGDECPDQAEDVDGFEDENGCPEDGGPPPAAEQAPPATRHHRGR